MAYSFDPRVEQAIANAAARYGVPLDAMRSQAYLESRGNPMAQNPNSSAGGLYQFIDSTAKQYGLQNKYDPYQASDAAARLMRDNYTGLQSALGRAPNAGELYLAHQQGLGGARRLLSNPNAPATSIVGPKAVALNGGNPNMSAGQFANLWVNKANNLAGQQTGYVDPMVSAPNYNPAAAASSPSGIASMAPQATSALPTVQEAAQPFTLPDVSAAASTAAAPAADPMGGLFGLLMSAKMSSAAPAAPTHTDMTVPKPKMVDNRSPEEQMAAVSQTPNVYEERLKRRAFYG